MAMDPGSEGSGLAGPPVGESLGVGGGSSDRESLSTQLAEQQNTSLGAGSGGRFPG